MSLKPTFIIDENGHKTSVIFTMEDYHKIMEELEAIDDVRLYDAAKKEDDGQRFTLDEVKRELGLKSKA